jgi:histidine triad (HIT) family protein
VSECLFCRIVARDSPADIQYEDDHTLGFKDIYPKAPVHVLVIPKRHIEGIQTMNERDVEDVGRCLLAARRIAEAAGYGERGYRVTVHCGPEGGQHVCHVHFHVLAGRRGSGG